MHDSEIIHAYSRTQALADGALVALDPQLCREAGFRASVAVSAAVYGDCIALTPAAKRACNDVTGRTWDVLVQLAHAARRCPKGAREMRLTVYAVVDRVRPTPVTLLALAGPGDEGELTITICYPGEE